jgi:hypothetical protein
MAVFIALLAQAQAPFFPMPVGQSNPSLVEVEAQVQASMATSNLVRIAAQNAPILSPFVPIRSIKCSSAPIVQQVVATALVRSHNCQLRLHGGQTFP